MFEFEHYEYKKNKCHWWRINKYYLFFILRSLLSQCWIFIRTSSWLVYTTAWWLNFYTGRSITKTSSKCVTKKYILKKNYGDNWPMSLPSIDYDTSNIRTYNNIFKIKKPHKILLQPDATSFNINMCDWSTIKKNK